MLNGSGSANGGSSIGEEQLLEIKRCASILLLSVIESRQDDALSNRILFSLDKRQLINTIQTLHGRVEFEDRHTVCTPPCACEMCCRDVGHALYVLTVMLAQHDRELFSMLKFDSEAMRDNPALSYFRRNTDQIEIFRDNRLEKIVFPKPSICAYLTEDSKERVYLETEVDEQESNIPDFFRRVHGLFEEMKWQKQLKFRPTLYWITVNFQVWKDLAFILSVILNIMVATCFPFDSMVSSENNSSAPFSLGVLILFGIFTLYLWIVYIKNRSYLNDDAQIAPDDPTVGTNTPPPGSSSSSSSTNNNNNGGGSQSAGSGYGSISGHDEFVGHVGGTSSSSSVAMGSNHNGSNNNSNNNNNNNSNTGPTHFHKLGTTSVFDSSYDLHIGRSSGGNAAGGGAGGAGGGFSSSSSARGNSSGGEDLTLWMARYKMLATECFMGLLALHLVLTNHVVFAMKFYGAIQLVNAAILLLSYLGNQMSHYLSEVDKAVSQQDPLLHELSRRQVLHDKLLIYQVSYVCICGLGLVEDLFYSTQSYGVFWYSLLMLDLVFYNPTLWNVIQSVTRNAKSILLTGMFALILVYMFSIAGFMFFRVSICVL